MNAEQLKAACLQRLDQRVAEHPAGHQGKLAARYLIRARDGDAIEIMFEKGPRGPANLWVEASRVSAFLEHTDLCHRLAPAATLYAVKGANGKPVYGRHSALKSMRDLAHADLVCIRIEALTELDRFLDHLQA
ncbi:hypothetical protein KUD11_01785 [Roseovarius sp. LXJ103]|uniref:hypothetical protein n=1 Tax=Roseovarius carneus TaxID=2853164 RepID=UPI000D60E381|nr:hypothetical protein [Roseovarius carneus]MBZ8117371.1 hypothetical protein [Roseovarius carneus]PWE36811.1 hypothetical protein DD563_13145 [Pelagicola sp. LXJ1103]